MRAPHAGIENNTPMNIWKLTLVGRALGLLVAALAARNVAAAGSTTAAASAKWWQNAVIYEIYPRSFQDSNADGIGDLNGIAQRLDYLQSLGVDAIWIAPMFPSPQVDFGYDVSDYENIDPQYGTLADFDRLLAQARKHNIRIILDMVLNHTSDQHPWFKAAAASRGKPGHDWYVWNDGVKDAAGAPHPLTTGSVCSAGPRGNGCRLSSSTTTTNSTAHSRT